MNKDIHQKKILIAPLDWGLGHATRCIIIIKTLLQLNCDVSVAASGKIKQLLQHEFPNITFLSLPGYNISYSKTKRILPFKILIQIPKIFKIIRFENNWLQHLLQTQTFDAVISDNRYGLYTSIITSVFITHQLQIKTNIRWLDYVLQQFNYNYINRFTECWVPDFKDSPTISGELSHPKKLPAIPVKYLGPLSRFIVTVAQQKSFRWMAIISGPEPQRTLFEKKIFEAASIINESFLIVRGLPGETSNNIDFPNCKVYNHLNTADMQQAIEVSEFVISRCGYTTVMEVLSLQKKSVLIPTPGQTEQEFLAHHLSKQNWCYTFNQADNFVTELNKAKQFQYHLPEINTQLYKTVITDFLNAL